MHDKPMHTLETTMGKMSMTDSPMKRMLPSFNLTAQDLPAIKGWSVGKKYKLELEVEQISMEKSEYMPGSPLTARFRITKVKDISMSEEESEAKKGHY